MRIITVAFVLTWAATLNGQDLVLQSGAQRTHLIELFTSQGCSSCPPAEAWLSKLKSDPGLWKNFVPVAFHVDYWDRLGWRDPFASKEWTARQYQYSTHWNSDGVYTPGFVLDGRELTTQTLPTASNEKSGALKLSIGNGKMTAEFVPADGVIKDVDLHISTLAFDVATKVTAGENSGRNLHQDFVVLSLTNEKMPGGKGVVSWKPDPRAGAIVAWVTAANDIAPIQAVGGWLKHAP